jgi:hypothetical protein
MSKLDTGSERGEDPKTSKVNESCTLLNESCTLPDPSKTKVKISDVLKIGYL